MSKGTSVVENWEELRDFLAASYDLNEDPSDQVCLLLVPWREASVRSTDIYACWDALSREVLLVVVDTQGVQTIPLKVNVEMPLVVLGQLAEFHVRPIGSGSWAFAPSLNIPGQLHAFIVMHGVPDPPPWEQLIVLATSF